NAPSSEALAYSWLGGRSLDQPEGRLRKLKRWLHAIRKLPLIHREERYRRRLAKKVDVAICVSSGLASYARNELGVEKVMVLPNGGPLMTEAQIKSRRLKREDDRFTVLYSGSAMYPWQGLDILAQTIRLAEDYAPDLRFVLAVNQRNDDLPSSGQVDVVEHLNRDEILDAICAADVCVSLHPEYTWSPYGFYNSPMKLFEYMACMTPVLTSNHGQMCELFSDKKDAYLCNNKPSEILRKIIDIRNDRVGANAVAIAGWQRIQSEFNWSQNAKKTVDLFCALLASMSKGLVRAIGKNCGSPDYFELGSVDFCGAQLVEQTLCKSRMFSIRVSHERWQ